MNADRGGRGEHLSAYLAGELDADERTALEAELDRDAVLRGQLERIRATNETLDRVPQPEPP
ncbi:MAG: anti-sigma factor family protein, partial [Nitriliruptorales bacterium]